MAWRLVALVYAFSFLTHTVRAQDANTLEKNSVEETSPKETSTEEISINKKKWSASIELEAAGRPEFYWSEHGDGNVSIRKLGLDEKPFVVNRTESQPRYQTDFKNTCWRYSFDPRLHDAVITL